MTERPGGNQPGGDQPGREPTAEELERAHRGTRRREPRYAAFIGTGVAAGLVVALLVTALSPGEGRYSTAAVLGYFSVVLAVLGALLGGLVAVLLARRR